MQFGSEVFWQLTFYDFGFDPQWIWKTTTKEPCCNQRVDSQLNLWDFTKLWHLPFGNYSHFKKKDLNFSGSNVNWKSDIIVKITIIFHTTLKNLCLQWLPQIWSLMMSSNSLEIGGLSTIAYRKPKKRHKNVVSPYMTVVSEKLRNLLQMQHQTYNTLIKTLVQPKDTNAVSVQTFPFEKLTRSQSQHERSIS